LISGHWAMFRNLVLLFYQCLDDSTWQTSIALYSVIENVGLFQNI
jgi:hypothetical protein